MTKKIILIVTLLFVASTSIFAQSENANQFIVNKWKIDLKEMKNIVIAKLKTEEQYQGLVGEQFDIAVETALEKVSNLKMEFNSDGSYSRTNSKGTAKGKWELSQDLKTLTTQTVSEPKKTFQVKEINKSKLVLFATAAGGTTFFFELDK